uniref:Uncharacterized protein n=1 Tax=Cucumis melo TaxID=3656 RepID=A0A9I9EKU0_CUCME
MDALVALCNLSASRFGVREERKLEPNYFIPFWKQYWMSSFAKPQAVPGDNIHKRRSICFSLRNGAEATLVCKGTKALVMVSSTQFSEVVVNCPELSLIIGTSSESYSYKSSISVNWDSSCAGSGDGGASMMGSQLLVASENGLASI